MAEIREWTAYEKQAWGCRRNDVALDDPHVEQALLIREEAIDRHDYAEAARLKDVVDAAYRAALHRLLATTMPPADVAQTLYAPLPVPAHWQKTFLI